MSKLIGKYGKQDFVVRTEKGDRCYWITVRYMHQYDEYRVRVTDITKDLEVSTVELDLNYTDYHSMINDLTGLICHIELVLRIKKNGA